MKNLLIKTIESEFGVHKVGSRRLKCYNFYFLCGVLKRLREGQEVK